MGRKTIKGALHEIGGLSNPSKMPSYSYGLPADDCKLGSLLRKQKGSTCSDCYAMKGMYRFPNVLAAMRRRAIRVRSALASAESRAAFVGAFEHILSARLRRQYTRGKGSNDAEYFRWHDSGDLMNVEHLELIASICMKQPGVQHWLPTREVGMVQGFVNWNIIPANLNIRLSAPRVDEANSGLAARLARRFGRITLSEVHRNVLGASASKSKVLTVCAAQYNEGECGECRACWAPKHEIVTYPLH
jgi:hypothetical protein